MYPQYKFYLENLDGNLLLLLTARKKKKTKTTVYQINYISFNTINNVQKYIETPIAKLKSNLLGTQFKLYDFGIKPSSTSNMSAVKTTNESPLNDNLKTETNNINYDNDSNNNNNNDDETNHENEINNASNNESINPSTESTHINDQAQIDENQSESNRKEYLSVSYELNVLGFKGPRQMSVVIPGMDSAYNREDYVLKNETDSLHAAWKKIESNLKYNQQTLRSKTATLSKLQTFKRSLFQLGPAYYTGKSTEDLSQQVPIKKIEIEENVVKLINKQPSFHRELRSFALNFRGRVTQASVKNFQIVHEINTDYIVMQFGKVQKDAYTCDYSYPICALQAFAAALTSLDNKLGCD